MMFYHLQLQAVAKLLRHSKKIGFPCENALLKINGKLKYISNPPPPFNVVACYFECHYYNHNNIDYIRGRGVDVY